MAKVLSSISGNLISAASAGYAPTNGTDVSAIASAYQVVSATAGRSYGGSTFITSINNTYISSFYSHSADSASRAWSASYDSTGRMISALPNSAAVSAIASSYAASAASSKQDSSAMSAYALSADVSGCIDTVSANSATWGTQVVTSLSGNANFYNQINSKSISSTVSYKARLDENGNSISALYNTVSAQSANWASASAVSSCATTAYVESGLSGKQDVFSAGEGLEFVQSGSDRVLQVDIVAGPGIVIDNPDGNTLRVSQAYPSDETVLYDDTATYTYGRSSVVLSESIKNFELIKIYTSKGSVATYWPHNPQNVNTCWLEYNGAAWHWSVEWAFTSNTLYEGSSGLMWKPAETSTISVSPGSPYNRWLQPVKIIGIHRIASN